MHTKTSSRSIVSANYLDSDYPLEKRENFSAPARIEKSFERCLISLSESLPQDMVIEDMLIKGDRVVVGYRTADSHRESNRTLEGDGALSVMSMEIISLYDGKVMERWNTVYQVKIDQLS